MKLPSEYFRNYAFKLLSGKRVRFEVVAATTERDNNKAPNGKERRFILRKDNAAVVEGNELVVQFEYRVDEGKRDQATLNQLAQQQIMILPDSGLQEWQRELEIKQPTEKNSERTLLEKYLTDFTAKNTFDYFIHKDLGGFLRRELDFYIKSEVIRLEDIENETPIRVKHFLSKVKVLRSIANKIIKFLAQIEDFQKKLWLKKKFVLETHYCVTLDRVPEELYPEIITNEAQIEEWIRLFAVDEIQEAIGDLFRGGTPGYSTPLTVDFLKANNKLLLDTCFFDADFKTRLIGSIENFDEQCDGLLIHAENFQALNLLQERYREQVKCDYIDPPYNTNSSSIPYKNNYQQQELALNQSDLRFREEYMLSYKLDTEARGSVSLLNPEAFVDPFNYHLKITQNDDTRWVAVDLVETFNYLLGLTVQRIRRIDNVQLIQGMNRQDQRVWALWRNLNEVDNDALDQWLIAQGLTSEEPEFDLIYVNGDNNLENLRSANQTWNVLLIDAEFHRLMFTVEDVQ